jgi:hypothetical protein
MDPATLSMLMPVIEKLLDKILDKLFNSTSDYSNSSKSPDDLKKLLGDLNDMVKDPDFVAAMQKYDPNFSMSGDIDTPKEIRDIKDVLLKAINDPSTSAQDRVKLESVINTLNEAATQLEKQGGSGENDLQLNTSETIVFGAVQGQTTEQWLQQLLPAMNGGAVTTPSPSSGPSSSSTSTLPANTGSPDLVGVASSQS